ncbi:hypothetical protein EDC04DRAFT_2632232, partial [Pisolithus marmoratus]
MGLLSATASSFLQDPLAPRTRPPGERPSIDTSFQPSYSSGTSPHSSLSPSLQPSPHWQNLSPAHHTSLPNADWRNFFPTPLNPAFFSSFTSQGVTPVPNGPNNNQHVQRHLVNQSRPQPIKTPQCNQHDDQTSLAWSNSIATPSHHSRRPSISRTQASTAGPSIGKSASSPNDALVSPAQSHHGRLPRPHTIVDGRRAMASDAGLSSVNQNRSSNGMASDMHPDLLSISSVNYAGCNIPIERSNMGIPPSLW